MSTQPSIVRQRANKTPEYLLISRLKRVLRIKSLQTDGLKIRSAMSDPNIASSLANLFSPLKEILTALKGVDGSATAILQFQNFSRKVLDLLSALRARVLDPADALNEIASLLDQGTPHWYAFFHKASVSPSSRNGTEGLFDWLRDLAILVGGGSLDLAGLWQKPHANSGTTLKGVEDDSEALLAFAKRSRNRQMELACRWVAGKTDSDREY